MSILLRLLVILSACAVVLAGWLGAGQWSADTITPATERVAARHMDVTIVLRSQVATLDAQVALQAYLSGAAAARNRVLQQQSALDDLTTSYTQRAPDAVTRATYPAVVRRFDDAVSARMATYEARDPPAAQQQAGQALAAAAQALTSTQQALLATADAAWTDAQRALDQARQLAGSERITGAAVGLSLVLLLLLVDFIRHGQPVIALSRQARRAMRLRPQEMPEFVLPSSGPGTAQELARALNSLVAQLREKYLDLERANASLHELNEEARAASQAKTAFVANISHELRTPLNAILGFSEMLMAGAYGPVNARQSTQLERVLRNGQQLLALINDVLDISRVEAGKITLTLAPVDVGRLVSSAAGVVEPLARQKGLAWRVEIAPQLPGLVSDENRLRQILLNLLSNAVKFTREGSVSLWVGQDATLPGWMLFRVQDTGVGIPATELKAIWQEFYQVRQGREPAGGGSGLGLAIVHKLVELLGGDAEVKSVEGQGSTFTIYMPLAPAAARDGAAGASLYAATGSYTATSG